MNLTSKAVAKMPIPKVQKSVLEYFVSPLNKAKGRTCEECEVALGMKHQTASARIRELVKAGLLEDTGKRAKNTTGRTARVYRAVKEVPVPVHSGMPFTTEQAPITLGHVAVIDPPKDLRPGQDAGEALVGVECYVWDHMLPAPAKVTTAKIVQYDPYRGHFKEFKYYTGYCWWIHARPVYLGKP